MPEYQLIIDLGIIFFTALVAGLMAFRFRQSLLFAYLIGGIIIGPHGLGWVGQAETISIFAEVGVTLLMFALGVEFSLHGILGVRSVAIKGGLLQIGLTVLLGYFLGRLMGFGTVPALVLGGCLSLSSTMIVMKTLMDRAETETAHGQVMLGILIVQDLAVVGMLAVIPVLPDFSIERLPELGPPALTAAAYLVLTVVLARTLIPALMRYAATSQHKELFALTVVGVCFTAALATLAIGFSLALGAFVAGLIVSESEYRHEVFAEVVPLRDVFTVLFFVSVGMLEEPSFFIRHLGPIFLVVVTLLIGKFAICALIVRGFGYHPRTAFLAGAGLAQIGEFSFLVARQAHTTGVISAELNGIILSSAIITILLTPFILQQSPAILERFPGLFSPRRPVESVGEAEGLIPQEHVIILGYGRVGNNIGASLMLYGIPFVVVDYDQTVAEQMRSLGFPAVFGDGSNPTVLAQAHPETARLAVVTIPDFLTARMAVRNLRHANPGLSVVARVSAGRNVPALYEEGAEEVVQPEFEAGIEMTRHSLVRLGIPLAEVQAQAERLRRLRYGTLPEVSVQPVAAEMHGHYILCGYGRLGIRISNELHASGVEHVIVEKDPDRVSGTTPAGVRVVLGDATDEAILRRAGVEHARGLVVTTSSDVDNLYITASARAINPNLFIMARISQDTQAEKFRHAGADRTIAPHALGARRMVDEILNPHVAEFLELAAGEPEGPWEMREVMIPEGSPLAGGPLREASRPGVTVVGLVTREGAILSHPGPDYELAEGDVLVVMGSEPDLQRLRDLAA